MKWHWAYLLNPLGAVADYINEKNGVTPEAAAYKAEHNGSLEGFTNTSDVLKDKWNQFKNWLGERYNDFTGKSNIELQNELDRQMAEEEYQRNISSIGDTAAAYEAAGFNRNILYGGSNGSPVPYSAPNLQAYSGSKKLDTILQRTGAVLNMIPAMYQATAALEGIDQARERTKQSEIKTMSMGMSLLDQGYKQGQNFFKFPFDPSLFPDMFSNKRHFTGITGGTIRPSVWNNRAKEYNKYADSALRNTFDLLESIGIKNQMNSTLNNWRGYQYSLDRRFGAAGRIVGMGSQGLRTVGSLFSPIKLFPK